jgi:hypothetical protein
MIRAQEAGGHTESGRFTSTIGTEKRIELARPDGKMKIADGWRAAETLRDPGNTQCIRHGRG